MDKTKKPSYKIQKVSKIRLAASEVYTNLESKHNVHALVDFNIIEARKIIKDYYKKTGEKLSFAAFVIKCVAEAVSNNNHIQAMRRGKRKLIIFEDVDVATIVERKIDGESWPVVYVIKNAHEKSYKEIHNEIRYAQSNETITKRFKKLVNLYMLFPGFIRVLIRRWVQRRPKLVKQYAGTVLVTSVGITSISGGWGIPFVGHPLIVTVGGIDTKPKVVGEKIEAIEMVNLTLTFDHDNLDGAPAARFTAQIKELIEKAYGLKELMK